MFGAQVFFCKLRSKNAEHGNLHPLCPTDVCDAQACRVALQLALQILLLP